MDEQNFIISENLIKQRQLISEKWGRLGLLDGLHGHIRDEITKLYECCPSILIKEEK